MRRIFNLVAILFFAAFLAACGGSDTVTAEAVRDETAETAADTSTDEAASEAQETADEAAPAEPADEPVEAAPEPTEAPAEETTEEAPVAAAEDAAPEPEPAADEPAADEPALSVSAADVLDSEDWCAAAELVEENFDSLDAVDFADPVALEQAYTQAGQILAASRQIAPDPLTGDLDVQLNAFQVLTDALIEAEWSFLDLDLSVIDDLDAEMTLSSFNIEKYNFEVCGIGSDPGSAPDLDDSLDSSEDLEFEGTIRDQALEEMLAVGLTPEEAECLVSRLDLSNVESAQDPAVILELFAECDIPLERLAELGG